MDELSSIVEYRDIPNYPGYRAGNDGSIWSCWKRTGSAYYGNCRHVESDTWKKLKPQLSKKTGRARYTLRHESCLLDQHQAAYYILLAFISPQPPGMIALHKDDDCTNDALYNLYWGTYSDNARDRFINNGKGNRSQLDEDEYSEIIERRLSGETLQSIADDYGLTSSGVYRIMIRYHNRKQIV